MYIGGLGFNYLEYFKKALLAKQGWRPIHNHVSLGADIIKAKYNIGNTR